MSTSPFADIAAAARLFADAMEKLGAQPLAETGDALTIAQAAKLLRLSKPHLYEQARTGALKVLRVGRSVRIPASEFESFRRRRLR